MENLHKTAGPGKPDPMALVLDALVELLAPRLAAALAERIPQPAPAEPTKLVSQAEAMKRLGVSKSTLAREIAACRLRPTRIGARSLISEAEIARYLAEEV